MISGLHPPTLTVFLMAGFGRPKGSSPFKSGFYGITIGLQFFNQLFGYFFLCFVVIKNSRSVLTTIFGTINRGVVKLKEVFGQTSEICLIGIKTNFYGFGVSGIFTAYFLVAWLRQVPAGKADPGTDHPRLLLKVVFFTPKAAGREDRYASFFLSRFIFSYSS